MRRIIMRASVLGLILGLASTWVSGQAKAGIVLGPPTILQGGDPYYIYEVPIFLEPNTMMSAVQSNNPFDPVNQASDDYLTIYNILGFQSIVGVFAAPHLQQGLTEYTAIFKPAGQGITPTGQTAPTPQPNSADITFYRVFNRDFVANPGTTNILLGYLAFQSNLPHGVPPTTVLEYTSQSHTLDGAIETDHGSVQAVPEPATATLMAAGLVVLVVFARFRRSSQPA